MPAQESTSQASRHVVPGTGRPRFQLLRRGSRGPEVAAVHQYLMKVIVPPPKFLEKEFFDSMTEVAVRVFQFQTGLPSTGTMDEATWRTLEKCAVSGIRAGAGMADDAEAAWLAVARKEIGQKEKKGAKHNKRIVDYHRATSLRASDDETAWCSSFINWCLKQVGIRGTNHAGAASWLKWGRASLPRLGAITVIFNPKAARSLTSTGNHVGFLLGVSRTGYVILGGNQSDQVKVSTFPTKSWQLKGHRWPY